LAAAVSGQPASPVRPAARVAAELKELAFDPSRCWRVRDLAIAREDLKLYLTDGFVALAKPLGGQVIAAIFWAEIEGGDGEIIVLPPSAGERQSLVRFTQAPNLNEHFRSAILIFTDGTAGEVETYLQESSARPAPEMGALLAGQYSSALRNLTASFESRIVQDVAGKVRPEYGLFFAAIAGATQRNFDAICDPQTTDQIVLAQLQSRENRSYYNIWTSFPSRRVRKDPATAAPLREFQIAHVAIDASLGVDLRLNATVTMRIVVPDSPGLRRERNALAFDVSQRVRIREVTVDGVAAQVLQRENLRSKLLRGSENEVFLVALEGDLPPGEHTVVFRQEGEVIIPAGNGVFFVSARGTWYPHHGLQFATYEMTFRCPKHLTVISTGDLLEERVDGDVRVVRRRSEVPLRLAGFNLGEYKRSTAKRGELTVHVYANKAVEASLTPARREVVLPPVTLAGRPQRQGTIPPPISVPQAAPDPAAQIEALAGEVAEAFEFMASRFGAPPFRTLAVSPIPGAFGQGFPGLIYLSTLAYLPTKDRPQFANQGILRVFFSDILVAHEVAHQWWGNSVTTFGYRDEWIMEALANYSALLLLERKRGSKALDEVLAGYRDHLLQDGVNGQPIEAAGPIHLGARLESSETPEAYRAIVYEKGTWIIHMLRHRLGDAAFFDMLREIHTRYLRGRLTTGDLQALAIARQSKDLPRTAIEQVFTSYVESTGIPTLRLQTRQKRGPKGVVVSVELAQTGVNEDFSIDVPIEIDMGRGKAEVRWLRSDAEHMTAEWTLAAAPVRITLDPRNSLLAQKRS